MNFYRGGEKIKLRFGSCLVGTIVVVVAALLLGLTPFGWLAGRE